MAKIFFEDSLHDYLDERLANVKRYINGLDLPQLKLGDQIVKKAIDSGKVDQLIFDFDNAPTPKALPPKAHGYVVIEATIPFKGNAELITKMPDSRPAYHSYVEGNIGNGLITISIDSGYARLPLSDQKLADVQFKMKEIRKYIEDHAVNVNEQCKLFNKQLLSFVSELIDERKKYLSSTDDQMNSLKF